MAVTVPIYPLPVSHLPITICASTIRAITIRAITIRAIIHDNTYVPFLSSPCIVAITMYCRHHHQSNIVPYHALSLCNYHVFDACCCDVPCIVAMCHVLLVCTMFCRCVPYVSCIIFCYAPLPRRTTTFTRTITRNHHRIPEPLRARYQPEPDQPEPINTKPRPNQDRTNPNHAHDIPNHMIPIENQIFKPRFCRCQQETNFSPKTMS